MRLPKRIKLVISMALLVIPLASFPDYMTDWPKAKSYYSSNRNYCFVTKPPHFSSLTNALKSNKLCKGYLYDTSKKGCRKRLWSGPLIHIVSPMSVLVSNNGYVVTIDSWLADESSTLAIYSPQGILVRRFKLEEIIDRSSNTNIYRTVTSIMWGGSHTIDDNQGMLVLKVVSAGDAAHYQDVLVDLATGSFK